MPEFKKTYVTTIFADLGKLIEFYRGFLGLMAKPV